MANKDKMNSIVQELEQRVIEHFLATQTAQISDDGTLDIFPDCRDGCMYYKVCEGKVCSLYLEYDKKPKVCQKVDDDYDRLCQMALNELSDEDTACRDCVYCEVCDKDICLILTKIGRCWCTPQNLFDKLNNEFNFVLDAAATDKTAKCRLYYTPETDGLSQSWDCGGSVFCNPPYERELGKWVKKAYTEANKGKNPIVLLIPARTDTTYFHDYIYGKAEIRFIRGRIRFTDENGNLADSTAPFPSMIVIYNAKTK